MDVARVATIVVAVMAGAGALYLVLAYGILPALWRHYESQPGLEGRPMLTVNAAGIPGDPINVGLVGDRAEAVAAMVNAGWSPADPITLRSSIEIAGSVLLDRPYPDAPVSSLYYEGRKQDLAFEKLEGESALRRHHVRFWLTLESGAEGRQVWLGSATFDTSVGLSHDTGQITHHIAPDVDAERDGLIADLTKSGLLSAIYQVTGIGPTLFARNGEGDRYHTDGEVTIGVLARLAEPSAAPIVAEAPAAVGWKNAIWRWLRSWMG